jgi:membrane protease YdiL (CAAX protease family)
VVFATGVIAVVGAILGIAYERTGNLTVSILAHGLYNAILMTIAYVSAVGWV